MQNRTALEQNFARILMLIERNVLPLIRKTQADGEERGEAVLNIENQTRAWQQNLSQAWVQPSEAAQELTFENDNRGQSFLERYSRLELLTRERRVLHEIKALWQTNSDLARESLPLENVVNLAEKAMDAERLQVVATLNRRLPAMPPAQLEGRKKHLL